MNKDGFDKEKFIKLLKLSASDADGEAVSALRVATKMLTKAELSWEEVLSAAPKKEYKTSETEREYAKGYRAGFKKATMARAPTVVAYRQSRPSGSMVFDKRRVKELIDRIMMYWDAIDPTQKHHVRNALDFWNANGCLPVKVFDELLYISRRV